MFITPVTTVPAVLTAAMGAPQPPPPPPNGNPGIVPPWLTPAPKPPDEETAATTPMLFDPTDPDTMPDPPYAWILKPEDPNKWRIM